MSTEPGFEDYLISKKIDSDAFRKAEPQLWEAWKFDFNHMHPNSFTVQKLNLINPIRRKYLLQTPVQVKHPEKPLPLAEPSAPKAVKPTMGRPVMGRPVIKPKPDQPDSQK